MATSRPRIAPFTVRGEFQTTLPSGRIRCDLCPRLCTLSEGQRGFCFVRQALGGDVALTSYGRASGFCIDPIEKKPLNHFLPGSAVLSFGTAGCNLGCRFCQNWDISKARALDRLTAAADPEDIAAAAKQHACRSIAFTYNDPVIFAEYAIDTALAARELDVRSVVVSAGYIEERARERFFAPMHAANIDLKAFTDDFYRTLCFAELQPVLDTLRYIHHETDLWLEVTTLLIPGHNDSDAELEALCEWFSDNLGPYVPLHFSAYHPDFKLDAPPTPTSTLLRARAHARAAGLKHVFTGNVHDRTGQSSYCAACDALLIERDWYRLGAWNLDADGRCRRCGRGLEGHFERLPDAWGPRRVRLDVVGA